MSSKSFNVEILKEHDKTHARVTKVTTPHGEFVTPTFMPVATRAYVNSMTTQELRDAGSQIILGGNTYHMLVNPGTEIIQAAGGMHPFMDWHGPMLTDSGGFQVFSLSKNSRICKIDEKGAQFKHPDTGKVIRLTPESSIKTQKIIGADIIMAFDQCTPDEDDKNAVNAAMQRTHRWLRQSRDIHDADPHSAYGHHQALFGIIQGSFFKDLREESTQFIVEMDCDGIAVGGEVIGFEMEKTCEVMRWILPMLPKEKSRYTMGVGLEPQNLIDVVKEGVDMFDCVAPTRNARHGTLYCGDIVPKGDWFEFKKATPSGKLTIKKSKYAKDQRPLLEGCECHTCQHYTRAYLHYLVKSKSSFYYSLACVHNIHVMQRVCDVMRKAVLDSH